MGFEPSSEMVIETDSPAATEEIGSRLGRQAAVGVCFDLRGELGSGKTTFVRGLARGLEIPGGVRSPTFTICHVHEGRLPLYHLDAYRIGDPGELLELGWDEMCETGVVAVEWGERLAPLLPPERVTVEFRQGTPASPRPEGVPSPLELRSLRLRAAGEEAAGLLRSLRRPSGGGCSAPAKRRRWNRR